MPIPFQTAVGAADDCSGRIVAIVGVAVAHAASKVDQRAIEQRAVAVGSRLQLADEFRELRNMIGRELRVLLDSFGFVSMMRNRMMGFRNSDVRVTAAASFMTNHEGEDAGN